ncbi:MAG: YdcF family protein [Bdellovibrionota bacterium]
MATPEEKPKSKISRRRLIVFLATGFATVSLTIAYVREVKLILAQTVTAWTTDDSADCGVVLTGGPNRIREGLDLLSRKAILKLIISGVHPQANLHEFFPQLPYYGDLHEQDVILERRSETTYGNAQQSLPLVEALHCRDLVLITSRSHMRRALLTFQAEFPRGFPILPRAVSGMSEPPTWDEVGFEALKSLFYSVWAY